MDTFLCLIDAPSILPLDSVTLVPGSIKARVRFKYDLNPASNYFPPSRPDRSQILLPRAAMNLRIIGDGMVSDSAKCSQIPDDRCLPEHLCDLLKRHRRRKSF